MMNRISTIAATVALALSTTVIAHAAPDSPFPLGGPYAKGFDDFVVVPPPPQPCKAVPGVGTSGEFTTTKDGTLIGPGVICDGDPSGSNWPRIERIPNQ